MVDFSWEASLVVMEQAITGRETPQALPRAILLLVNEKRMLLKKVVVDIRSCFKKQYVLTSEQRRRVHFYPHTAEANAIEFQWALHPQP